MSKNKSKNKPTTKDLAEATAEIPPAIPGSPEVVPDCPEAPEVTETVLAEPKTKRVRATKKGFYDGHIKGEGVVFEVPVGLDAKWFQDEGLPMPKKKKPDVLRGQSPVAVAKATGPAIPKGKFAEGHFPEDWEA